MNTAVVLKQRSSSVARVAKIVPATGLLPFIFASPWRLLTSQKLNVGYSSNQLGVLLDLWVSGGAGTLRSSERCGEIVGVQKFFFFRFYRLTELSEQVLITILNRGKCTTF